MVERIRQRIERVARGNHGLERIHIHGAYQLFERTAMADANALEPVIAARYAFDDLPDALDHLARGAFGKIVVVP